MKKIYLIISMALLFGISHQLDAQQYTFQWQGVQRQYIIRQPTESYDETSPVVFFLHGLGDNIARCDAEYNFTSLANRYGWTFVVPQALNEGMGTMWNAAMTNSTIDDVGFLMALLDTLTIQCHLDTDSVFFTGFSMGGFMTHRMAIEKGDRITACAPVSGLITFTMSHATPVAPVKMLHIHGTSDPVVGYDGNSQYFGGTLGIGVNAILDYWKAANGCEGEPSVDSLPDTHNDGLRFVRYTYDCGTELQHLKVIGGAHNWYHNSNQYDISYMDEIHDFFTVDQHTTTALDEPKIQGLKIWPNPAKGEIAVEVLSSGRVTVMNLLGEVVWKGVLEAGKTRIDLSSYRPGIYFIRTQDGEAKRFVLQ